jgi:hypothetical protein
MASNMQRAKAGHDIVADPGASSIRTIGELCDRLKQRIPIDSRLIRAEIFRGLPEDIHEVELGGGAQPDAPFPPGHRCSFGRVGDNFFGNAAEKSSEIIDAVEFLELATVQGVPSQTSGAPQCFELCTILSLTPFDLRSGILVSAHHGRFVRRRG